MIINENTILSLMMYLIFINLAQGYYDRALNWISNHAVQTYDVHLLVKVLQLQRLEEPFVDGRYVETAHEGECIKNDISWKPVFGNGRVQIGKGTCVFAQGRFSVLKDFLKDRTVKRQDEYKQINKPILSFCKAIFQLD